MVILQLMQLVLRRRMELFLKLTARMGAFNCGMLMNTCISMGDLLTVGYSCPVLVALLEPCRDTVGNQLLPTPAHQYKILGTNKPLRGFDDP